MFYTNPFQPKKQPTMEQLWVNEKSKYRIWIFLFPAILATIFILSIANIIVLTAGVDASDVFKHQYKNTLILSNIVTILLLSISITYYTISIFNSYKEKNFLNIGQRSIGISFFAFLTNLTSILTSFSQIIISSNKADFDFNYNAILVIWIIIVAATITEIFSLRQVLKIKSLFLVSYQSELVEKQIEDIRKNPEKYQDILNMFGPQMAQNFANQSQKTNQQEDNSQENKAETTTSSKEQEIHKKISNLSIKELHELAQKLEISSYYEMKPDELIKIIVKILASE
ncbi:Uncharacterised protein [Mesomycoplasma conjunctivae]|uniref:Rho termination factor N-terminal domain-containing protein n=1 Tax=Mesomycoplasma conjunctivae (strain ATCC 25834 / NCTC 10147 / HRC/581) TaxID=572263 RepID=C5J6M6_MESCH|nr:hypothetical protein [Mesomycoplasma conjunctivae]CAT05130.1 HYPOTHETICAL PROTEIN MCJ_004330 [Mesomycoplasma conjunctivae]VEU66362.1 Uncharacterised protein [Mesomycoplasma conjunctivae]